MFDPLVEGTSRLSTSKNLLPNNSLVDSSGQSVDPDQTQREVGLV